MKLRPSPKLKPRSHGASASRLIRCGPSGVHTAYECHAAAARIRQSTAKPDQAFKSKGTAMNVNITPPRIGPQTWEVVRGKLDQALPFANMRETPYYRDAVYEQFSRQEYERRYAALRSKMREHKLDCIIAAGGPSHWSFGGGMLWLTGHW